MKLINRVTQFLQSMLDIIQYNVNRIILKLGLRVNIKKNVGNINIPVTHSGIP